MFADEKPKADFLTYSQIHNFINNQGGESESVLFQTKSSSNDLSDPSMLKVNSNNLDDKSFIVTSSQLPQQISQFGNSENSMKESINELTYSISYVNEKNEKREMTAVDEVSMGQESSIFMQNDVNQVTKQIYKNQRDNFKRANSINEHSIESNSAVEQKKKQDLKIEKLLSEVNEFKQLNKQIQFELGQPMIQLELSQNQLSEEKNYFQQKQKMLEQKIMQNNLENEIKIQQLLKKTFLDSQKLKQNEKQFKAQDSNLTQTVQDLQQQNIQLNNKIEQLDQEKVELMSIIKDKDSSLQKSSEEKIQLEDQLRETDKRLKALEDKLKESDRRFKALEELLKRSDKDLKNQNQKLKELLKENDELKKQQRLKSEQSIIKNSNQMKHLLFQMEHEQQNLKRVTDNIQNIYRQLQDQSFENSFEDQTLKKQFFPSSQQMKLMALPQKPVSTYLAYQQQQMKRSNVQQQQIPQINITQRANATFPQPIQYNFVQFPIYKMKEGIRRT